MHIINGNNVAEGDGSDPAMSESAQHVSCARAHVSQFASGLSRRAMVAPPQRASGNHRGIERSSVASGAPAPSHLAEIWRTARAAWPTVQLDAETFLTHLARHLPGHAVAPDDL